jgi:hypothetical protein
MVYYLSTLRTSVRVIKITGKKEMIQIISPSKEVPISNNTVRIKKSS